MSDIKPALTEWEWRVAKLAIAGKMVPTKQVPGYDLVDSVRRPEKKHAIAALCLHDQPFGFDWTDVDVLREAADSPDLPNGGYYESLADRIAYLLPPREDDAPT
jgi:hypothetical protein